MKITRLRYIPLLAASAATAMFFAAAVPSQAATRVVAAPQTTAKGAGPQVARDHEGIACRTVHSTPHNRTAKICVMVNSDDLIPGRFQGLVNFALKSGKIKNVCVRHLNFWDNGSVVRSVSKVCKKGGGQKNFISTRWWDVPPPFLNHVLQAGVYDPCIYWTDGSSVCIHKWVKGPKDPIV